MATFAIIELFRQSATLNKTADTWGAALKLVGQMLTDLANDGVECSIKGTYSYPRYIKKPGSFATSFAYGKGDNRSFVYIKKVEETDDINEILREASEKAVARAEEFKAARNA